MLDLWKNINPSKADHVLGVVGGTLDEIMATSKHRLVVTPMHEKIINAIIEYCRSKHLRPLILVTDSVASSSWERVFRKRLKDDVDERKIFYLVK